MMTLTRFANVLGATVDDGIVDIRNVMRRLRQPRKEEPGRLNRCHATTKSGSQCKRHPVPGSMYCFQHRQEKGMMLVVDTRSRAAQTTTDISQKARVAAVGGVSQLVSSSSDLGARVLKDKRISGALQAARGILESIYPRNGRAANERATLRPGELSPNLGARTLGYGRLFGLRGAARRLQDSLRAERRWVAVAAVLAFMVAISYVILSVVNLNPLVAFAREIIPRAAEVSPAIGRDPEPLSGQVAEDADLLGLFSGPETGPPGTDFRGAYVSNVEHLSNGSSMLEIFVPAGVEGEYQAIVSASEGSEFECVILHQYADRLYCIGARLSDGSQVNVKIFWLDEVDGSQHLVFETDYTTGEDVTPPPVPTQPVIVPYGGGFTWPDRFDGIEQQREEESTRLLWPLSVIFGLAALWLLMRVGRDARQTKLLIERREPQPIS